MFIEGLTRVGDSSVQLTILHAERRAKLQTIHVPAILPKNLRDELLGTIEVLFANENSGQFRLRFQGSLSRVRGSDRVLKYFDTIVRLSIKEIEVRKRHSKPKYLLTTLDTAHQLLTCH